MKKNFNLIIFLFVINLLCAQTVQAQTTYYVRATNGSDSNNGTSTSTPFEGIKAAVSAATTGDKILVSAETYTINSVITVNEDIDITGGYDATFSEQTGYTTLDGNTAKRIIDFIGVADSVTFDHFIIQNGYRYNGGGMYIEESDLSLTNIIFYNNTASGEKGGAIYMDKSNPTLTNVAFIGNSSNQDGGAMYLDESCPTLTNATFYDNTATNTAGSIYLIGASIPVIRNTVFYNNIAQSTSYEDIDSYNWTNCYVSPSSVYNASNNANAYDNPFVLSARYGTFVSFVLLLSDPFINSSDPDGDDNIFGTYDDGLVPANLLKEKGHDSYNPLSYDLIGRNRKIGTIDIGAYEGILIYHIVNGLETGNHDGSDWDNAFDDLGYAINNYGTKGVIFHVATATTSQPYFLDGRLEVTEDIEIYGGYDVTTDTQTGYSALDGNGEHQVIYTEGLTSKAVFDHLIIQNGYAGSSDYYGGGMYNKNSSPTLTNVIFKGNEAYWGGGLYNDSSKPKLINVVFNKNTAKILGGGMFNNTASPTLRNVIFTGNSAVSGGGGMYSETSSKPILINVVFNGNSSNSNGAAIYNLNATTLTLINVTFVNNSASGKGVIYQSETTLNLYNTVFYANTPIHDIYNYNISSDILGTNNASDRSRGGVYTEGFILLTSDPFANSSTPEGDDGEWLTSDDGLIPAKGSQLINTGDKSYNSLDTDILGEQRVQKNRIDIGAYETDYYAASSTFTGTGSWGIDTLWSAGIIDDGGTAIIDGICRITSTDRTVDDLTIKDSASLSIYSGVDITVNDDMTIESGGTCINKGTLSVGGTTTVKQNITGNSSNGRSWYLSSPVSGATSKVFLTSESTRLWYYDETTPNYSEITDEATTINVGEGYVVQTVTDETIEFAGTLHSGDMTLSPTRTGTTAAKRGYNLIGNPYPAYLDWDALYDASTNMRPTIWYSTVDADNNMIFDVYNAEGENYVSNSGSTVTGIIAPCQAIWVKVDADGSNGSLPMTSDMISTGDGETGLKSSDVKEIIRIKAVCNETSDETLIAFLSSADNGFDIYDSEKQFVSTSGLPQLYSFAGSTKAVINGLSLTEVPKEISLGLTLQKDGNYSLVFTEISSSTTYYLYDKTTGSVEAIYEGYSYDFAGEAGDFTDRFTLRTSIATEIDDIVETAIKIYNSDHNLIINTNTSGTLTVTDILGRVYYNQNIEAGTTTIPIIETGKVFLVSVQTKKAVVSQRVVF